MLSTVFLLLYVVATLRSGSFGMEKNAEYQRLAKEAEDLKEQIRVFRIPFRWPIAKGSESEQETYANLMDKLKLLQDRPDPRKRISGNRRRKTKKGNTRSTATSRSFVTSST